MESSAKVAMGQSRKCGIPHRVGKARTTGETVIGASHKWH